MIPTTESVTSLAKRWAAGDRRAGSELVAKHDGWIRAYARRKALPWEDVDDVAQMMRLGFLRCATEELPAVDGLLRWKLRRRMLDDFRRSRNVHSILEYGDDGSSVEHGGPSLDDQVDLHSMMRRSGMTQRQRRVMAQILSGDLAADVAKDLDVHPTIVAREWDRGISALRMAAGVEFAKHARIAVRGQTARCQRIVNLLTDAGPLHGPKIRELLGDSEERTLAALRILITSGEVTSEGTPNKRLYSAAAARCGAA